MGSFTKGEIVLYPFPFTDLSKRKLRPCLVISNKIKKDIILCQITSQNISFDSYSVSLKNTETIKGNLKIDSFIRCNMIFTADSQDIIKVLCKIRKNKYEKVINIINSIIKL